MTDIWIKRLLIALEFFVGLTAAWGGIKLLQTGGLGMPVSWLSDSPFSDYTLPALILAVIVGGTNLLSAFLEFRKHTYAAYSSAVAGYGLLIWIFTEMYLLKHASWLQVAYFSIAILILVLTMLLLKLQTYKKVGEE